MFSEAHPQAQPPIGHPVGIVGHPPVGIDPGMPHPPGLAPQAPQPHGIQALESLKQLDILKSENSICLLVNDVKSLVTWFKVGFIWPNGS